MDSEAVIKLQDVWVDYEGIPALEAACLTVRQYDFLGIIGPNGGGKSTLLKVILGLVKPNKGKITVFGDTPERGRKHIGYVPQHSNFDHAFPIGVWDAVLMGRLHRAGLFRRYGNEDRDAAKHALSTVGMLEYRDRQIGKLSGGQRQRVLVARALTTDPQILLLDEPTASIDTSAQSEFYDLLAELKHKLTIILVSHDLSAVSVHVEKIACLNRRLFYHNSKEIPSDELEATYNCPVDMIAHGIPHRILREH
ncbi:MAG: ABC transporter ATP-binding protein [Chloroflexota bacterium]|nr:ABC transporter ATP-binding protein [Chloroflexota bacterium]